MTEVHESERMHAISRETWDTVDQVLDYARRRALFENVPLDKPMRPTDLARLASGSITAGGIGARRAIGLFENVLAPACITTDHPGVSLVHPVCAHEGGARVRRRGLGVCDLRRIVARRLGRGVR